MWIQQGSDIIIRVRAVPNSSCCGVAGVFVDAKGVDFLKIKVHAVPEKGKANQEIVNFLSDELKLSKSHFQIVGGKTDKFKKILIQGQNENFAKDFAQWVEKKVNDN